MSFFKIFTFKIFSKWFCIFAEKLHILFRFCRKSPKQKKPITSKKPIKQPRVWDLGGNANDLPSLERKIEGDPEPDQSNAINLRINTDVSFKNLEKLI